MVTKKVEIKTYYAQLYKSKNVTGGTKVSAQVWCNSAEGYTLFVYFVLPENPIPSNWTNFETKRGAIYTPNTNFLHFIDILRNEKPLFAYFYDDAERNTLGTASELVGEEET